MSRIGNDNRVVQRIDERHTLVGFGNETLVSGKVADRQMHRWPILKIGQTKPGRILHLAVQTKLIRKTTGTGCRSAASAFVPAASKAIVIFIRRCVAQ